MDSMLRDHDSLNRSNTHLDEYILMGRQALNELVEQRGVLKATQRRMLDVANNLGLSTTVIRFIEQRTSTD
ncbi:protein transport protein bos1, partial [Nowakowskiella sp. JEL0078]